MSDSKQTNIERVAARPIEKRWAPDVFVRCSFCDQGLIGNEAFEYARECCDKGRNFDSRPPGRLPRKAIEQLSAEMILTNVDEVIQALRNRADFVTMKLRWTDSERPKRQTVERFSAHQILTRTQVAGPNELFVRLEDYQSLERAFVAKDEAYEKAMHQVSTHEATIERLEKELETVSQNCHVLAENHNVMREQIAKLQADNKALREALRKLIRGYVSTLESARDRIRLLGGTCDSITLMEINDPHLIEARAALAAREET